MSTSIYRYSDGHQANTLAIGYAFGGYAVGIGLLLMSGWLASIIGTLLLAHAMIIAAYLIHEFAHGSIFKEARHNERAGMLCGWLTGSCYADFKDLRHKHLRHHVDRADVITFDSKAFLRRLPAPLRMLVVGLEWVYVPAVELIMHAYVIVLPFVTDNPKHRARRGKVAVIFTVRTVTFAVLGWLSLKALVLYAMAWVIMVTVLRFVDAYQHTYDAFAVIDGSKVPDDKLRDRAYEQHNTFSNIVSVRYPMLNLLLLNFAYHNAHHEKPVVPWYRLPAFHKELYGDGYRQVIPMSALLTGFHRHRLRRVMDDDYGVVTAEGNRVEQFYGAVGVSFLTAV